MKIEEAANYLKEELARWERDCKSKHPMKDALALAIQMLETGEVYMTGEDYNLYIEGYKAGMKDYKSLVEESDPVDSENKVRLINANALLRRIDGEREYLKARGQLGAEHILVHNFRELVETAPAVDCVVNTIEVRPKGKWESIKKIDDDAEYGEIDAAQCSVCKFTEDSEYWAKTYYNFCPNCGAQMIKAVKKNENY